MKTVNQSVTIKQIHKDDELYAVVEKIFLTEYGTKPALLRELLFGGDSSPFSAGRGSAAATQHTSPKLFVITSEGELIGHVITFDFYQATYISTLNVKKEKQCCGYGTMLLQHVCHAPNRTYVLLSEVAMSDNERLSDCVRRKIFYLRNGFRSVPIKWRSAEYYRYDVHVKGPDQELGSLLAALRKGMEIWITAELSLLKKQSNNVG